MSETVLKEKAKAKLRDHFFVSQNCSLVITTNTRKEAIDILKQVVIRPQAFSLSLVKSLKEQFTNLKCYVGSEPTIRQIRSSLKKTVTIEVFQGVVSDVRNLPKEWNYEVLDLDEKKYR